MIVISRINQRFGQFHLLSRRTPIPQAPAIRFFPDDDSTGVSPRSQIGNPLFHAFIMTVQQNRIAIITIIGPRHNHISRAPCRATSSATEGSGMRNIAALPVPGVLHIVKPFPVKLGHIERQDRTFHDYLRVSGIGQPLPVRTVTADTTVEVIFLRSQVNLVDLVKQFVRTTETSGRPWIGMHDFCHQTFPAHPDLSGYNFDIAKRMPSETRLPLFYSTTPQCIKVHLPEIILLLSDKAELYPVSGIALHLYMRPA